MEQILKIQNLTKEDIDLIYDLSIFCQRDNETIIKIFNFLFDVYCKNVKLYILEFRENN